MFLFFLYYPFPLFFFNIFHPFVVTLSWINLTNQIFLVRTGTNPKECTHARLVIKRRFPTNQSIVSLETQLKLKWIWRPRYVKYYAGALGSSTTARGWVEGGAVKDDDLVHKFADISEPTVQKAGGLDNFVFHLTPLPIPTIICEEEELQCKSIKSDKILHHKQTRKGKAEGTNKRSNVEPDDEQGMQSVTTLSPKEQKVWINFVFLICKFDYFFNNFFENFIVCCVSNKL